MYKPIEPTRTGPRSRYTSAPRRLLSRLQAELEVRWAALRGRCRATQPAPAALPRLGVAELRSLLTSADLAGGPFGTLDRTLIEMGASTRRIRLAELLALRWGDVDWLAGTVRVERTLLGAAVASPKSGHARQVRLSPHSQVALRSYRASLPRHSPDDLVFGDPRSASHLNQEALRRRLRIALERANLPKLAFVHLASAFRAPWWSRYL